MHKCKKQRQKATGYHYPTPSVVDHNHMANSERIKRERERKLLDKFKYLGTKDPTRNSTPTRQLAIYVKDGNTRTLVGVVNDYECIMWWHDVTTSGSFGMPQRISDLAPKTLNEFCGIVAGMYNVHAYAQRF